MSTLLSFKHGFARRPRRAAATLAASLVALALVAGPVLVGPTSAGAASAKIVAVGAENEYANVLAQIGGKYVSVTSILNNPNTDPHTFEASPSVAEVVGAAQIVVQNGVGYDGFMNQIESASPNAARQVIVAQNVLGLPTDTKNPHLWYKPTTMQKVARVMAKDLEELAPGHASYFRAHLATFEASLRPWFSAIAAFKAKYDGTPVAVTEPVADYLLRAMGAKILTPFVFQADIMNGVDPSPEDVSLEEGYFTKHQVKVFCYNQQVVDALTTSIRETAIRSGVPVVGVYETMPTPGYDFQTWMTAEVAAIQAAVVHGKSTEKL